MKKPPKNIWVVISSDGCVWAENLTGLFMGTKREAFEFIDNLERTFGDTTTTYTVHKYVREKWKS